MYTSKKKEKKKKNKLQLDYGLGKCCWCCYVGYWGDDHLDCLWILSVSCWIAVLGYRICLELPIEKPLQSVILLA